MATKKAVKKQASAKAKKTDSTVKVALLGFGTVGSSVARVLAASKFPGVQLTHIFNRDVARRQIGMLRQGPGRCQRIRASGTDCQYSIIGRDDVSIARQKERTLAIGNDQKRFQMPKYFIRAPFLTELDGCALEISVILLEFTFEAR